MSELRRHKLESAILREVSTYMHLLEDKLLSAVTITHVEVSEDLRYARVFYTILGHEEEEEEISRKLAKASKRIQRDLANRLKTMRYIPLLSFQFDLSIQKGDRVIKILDEIENELRREESNDKS